MKKRLDTTLRFFWGGSYGSIYPTLNQLETEGKVTKENTSSNGREKISYSITEYGKESLKEWLQKPVEKDELRYETLLKVFLEMKPAWKVQWSILSDLKKSERTNYSF